MKILYPLLCYYPSSASGTAKSVYSINKELARLAVKSIVLSTTHGLKGKPDHENLYQKHKIEVNFLPKGSTSEFLKRKYIRNIDKVDIVHFSSIFFQPTLFYLVLSLVRKKKIVISPHGELYPTALKRGYFKKRIYLSIVKLFQKSITFHATNHEELRMINRYFKKCGGKTIIPNYLEIPPLYPSEKKKQILFLGRINPIKNIDILIDAYTELPDSIKGEYTLIIAGESRYPYEENYHTLLKNKVKNLNLTDRIKFAGNIIGEEKYKLYRESFCFVLPSKSENFGNVVPEALSQGTPVIVSNKAPWRLVEENEIGRWIPPTASEIKSAIMELISLPGREYTDMQKRAREVTESHFDIKKNIMNWNQFYKGLRI